MVLKQYIAFLGGGSNYEAKTMEKKLRSKNSKIPEEYTKLNRSLLLSQT